MCLGIPAKVVEVKDGVAIVDMLGVRREVDITLVPEVRPGDVVVIHAGAAIAKLDEEQARESLEFWKELMKKLEEDFHLKSL